MEWIQQFTFFLFDLDGLLVNTENIHFRAYKKMCKDRGFDLLWDLTKYYSIAQQDADAVKKALYQEFPELETRGPRWEVLYKEKKEAFLHIAATEEIPLLPGAKELLLALESAGIKRCVVTHSPLALVEVLREQNPLLHTIPHWFTREDYKNPKPAPDGYEIAIHTLAKEDDRIIGFEDSDRGMRALMQTRAFPILVNPLDASTRKKYRELGCLTFSSLEEIIDLSRK